MSNPVKPGLVKGKKVGSRESYSDLCKASSKLDPGAVQKLAAVNPEAIHFKLAETIRRFASPLDAGGHFGRAIHAQACISSGGLYLGSATGGAGFWLQSAMRSDRQANRADVRAAIPGPLG